MFGGATGPLSSQVFPSCDLLPSLYVYQGLESKMVLRLVTVCFEQKLDRYDEIYGVVHG